MADEFRDLFTEWGYGSEGAPQVHMVETCTGRSATGKVYAEARPTDPCMVTGESRVVRTSTGEEVTSSEALLAPLDHRELLALSSRVTLADGRVRDVLALEVTDVQDFPAFVTARLG